jgi:regulator of replication initiation timing
MPRRLTARARALLDEAKQIGLVDERVIGATYEATLAILRRVARDTDVDDRAVMSDGEELATLRNERQGLRTELEHVNAEIRSTRTFTTETSGYEREAKEQRARLSAVGLFSANGHDQNICPVCASRLTTLPPTVTAIGRSLRDLSQQLETVEAENPRLQMRLAALLREAAQLQDRLRENQLRIATACAKTNSYVFSRRTSFFKHERLARLHNMSKPQNQVRALPHYRTPSSPRGHVSRFWSRNSIPRLYARG